MLGNVVFCLNICIKIRLYGSSIPIKPFKHYELRILKRDRHAGMYFLFTTAFGTLLCLFFHHSFKYFSGKTKRVNCIKFCFLFVALVASLDFHFI